MDGDDDGDDDNGGGEGGGARGGGWALSALMVEGSSFGRHRGGRGQSVMAAASVVGRKEQVMVLSWVA